MRKAHAKSGQARCACGGVEATPPRFLTF